MKRFQLHPLALLFGVVCFLVGSNLAIFWSHEIFRLVFEPEQPSPSTSEEPPGEDPDEEPTEREFRPTPAPSPPERVRRPEVDDPGSPAPMYRGLDDGCGRMRTRHHGRVGTLAPKHTDYQVDIRGDLAGVTVAQTFDNPTDATISGVYQFPLNHEAAVYAMTMEVGERTIRADIKRREEAKRAYEKARREGKHAALLSQQRPNWFTQRVANIAPDETVEVTLRYVHPLPLEEGAHQLVLPMQLGPRYGAGGTRANDLVDSDFSDERLPSLSGRISDRLRRSRSGPRVSVDVQLDAPMPVETIRSSSHAVRVREYSDRRMRAELADPTGAANEHFRLRFSLAGDEPEAGVNAYWDEEKAKGYFSLLLEPPPQPDAATVADRELVFVLDTSGSMRGARLEASKRFVKRALRQLHHGRDAFRIVRFSNSATGFTDHAVPASDGNIESAIEYVDGLRAGGGTHYRPGIERALEPPSSDDRMRMVLFVTDGLIGYEYEVLGLLGEKRDDARLYGIGVGDSANRHLLEEMSRKGRGFARFLDPSGPLTRQIDETVRRIRTPVMTDVRVDWGDLEVDGLTPNPIPDLFAGESVRVHGTYETPGTHTVTVRGRVGGERVAMPMEMTVPETDGEGRAVELTWARRQIADQTHRLQGDVEEAAAIKKRVTDLGLEYSLATRWTSFVAVDDEGRETAPIDDRRGSRSGEPTTGDDAIHSLHNRTLNKKVGRGAGGMGLRGSGSGGGGEGFGRVHALGNVSTGGSNGGSAGAKVADKESTSPEVIPHKPDVDGSLDRKIVRNVIRQHRAEIKQCYEEQLRKDRDLEGRVAFQFTVAPTGSVVAVLVDESTLDNRAAEQCMSRNIRRWSFPAYDGGGLVKVNYPYTFSN